MWSSSDFRMPDGAEIRGRQGDVFEVRVSVPSDEHGFFGRRCPACEQVFRVDGDDYSGLPDDLRLWCVYCGHHDDHSEFMTMRQRDRVLRAAGDLGLQIAGRALDEAFGRISRKSRSIRYRSKPFYPRPLPGITEEKSIRIRQCAGCALRYAVFGEHRFCPVCGKLPLTWSRSMH